MPSPRTTPRLPAPGSAIRGPPSPARPRTLPDSPCLSRLIFMTRLADTHQFFMVPVTENAIFTDYGFKHSLPVSLVPRPSLPSVGTLLCLPLSQTSLSLVSPQLPKFSPTVSWWPPRASHHPSLSMALWGPRGCLIMPAAGPRLLWWPL